MEYGSFDFGKFLKDKIAEDGRLNDHLIKYYWDAMLKAVQALHNEGTLFILNIDTYSSCHASSFSKLGPK